MSHPIDLENGRELKPGHMSCAEFREWYPRMRARWRAALGDPEKPPDESGRWTWVRWIGWIRRKEGGGR